MPQWAHRKVVVGVARDDDQRPRDVPGPLSRPSSESRLLENERQFHVDTEMLDRAVLCELDLVLGYPCTPNAIDRLLSLRDALADGILEGSGGSRRDLDHLGN